MITEILGWLRDAVGDHADFRPGQWKCIEALLARKRLLVVQRTGWGKSAVYFLATRALRKAGAGPTLLVSPLLSLMRNQIKAAGQYGIEAATINSENTDEWNAIEQRFLNNKIDLLMVSPERLANDRFRDNVLVPAYSAGRMGMFVVDEAHCISDWGHDFRPDYQRMKPLVDNLPSNIPLLATTATANDRVVRDVMRQLGADVENMPPRLETQVVSQWREGAKVNVVRGPLVRESLALQNITMPSPAARMAWLDEHIESLPGSGIIYVLTTRDADRIAEWLKLRGHRVEAYHAQIDEAADEGDDLEVARQRREKLEDALLRNEVKALISTVALGMGFDKPDVGFTIHFQRPGSVVHYYQQVGRAGRALPKALGIMFSGEEDADIVDFFIRSAFPPIAHFERVIRAIEEAPDGLKRNEIERHVNLGRKDIEKVLKIQSVARVTPITKRPDGYWVRTPGVQYTPDRKKISDLIRLRKAEQSEMFAYQNATDCLMERLIRALDDPDPKPCGKCANCVGEPLYPTGYDEALANEAAVFLQRSHRPLTPRKQWPITGIFESYPTIPRNRNIAEGLRACGGMALSLWGDAGWGQTVREGRLLHHRYPDELVTATADMMRKWDTDPKPTWMTYIPPRSHPEALRQFCVRLAKMLQIPFVECISRTRTDNKRQYQMRNSYMKAHNLDGVYSLEPARVRREPMLLLTDVVDSRWTCTVVAALLRAASSSPLFPVALALRDVNVCEEDSLEYGEPCDNATDGSCSQYTHSAVWAMAGATPEAIQRRWKSRRFGDDYPMFETAEDCVGYLQQYALLHGPQIQAAVEALLRKRPFGAAGQVRVLDVGAGPATLGLAISRVLPELLGTLTFDLTAIEPSGGFCAMLGRFEAGSPNGKLHYTKILQESLSDALSRRAKELAGQQWIVAANALVPIAQEGDNFREGRVYDELNRLIAAAVPEGSSAYLTLIESSVTHKYLPRINEMLHGLGAKLPGWRVRLVETVDANIDAPWLVRCKFFLSGRLDAQAPHCLCRHYEVKRA